MRSENKILAVSILVLGKRRIREGEERRESWGGSERECWRGGIETKFRSLKVPRQCPLVLQVEARLIFGICSILNIKDVGAAVAGRNVVASWNYSLALSFLT
jgi:hypothetical protein